MIRQPSDWDSVRVRQLRTRLGMSQTELSAAINAQTGMRVHRHAVSRWERGEVQPSAYVRIALDTLDQENRDG